MFKSNIVSPFFFIMALWFSAGHGREFGDTGALAVHGKVQYAEADVIRQVLDRAREITKQQGLAVSYIPYGLKLSDGTRLAWIRNNVTSEDVLVELHMNSAGSTASGTEMFYQAGQEAERVLADKYLKAYLRATGQRNRGVKPDTASPRKQLAMVRLHCPSVLLEMGFLSNNEDLDMVFNKAALGVVNIALSYHNKPFLDKDPTAQVVSPWAEASVEKVKNFVGPRGKKVWENWKNPQDELSAYTFAHILYKLGALDSPEGILTNERACVALDRLGLWTKKN